MVGILVSYWGGLFSGAMLVLGSVAVTISHFIFSAGFSGNFNESSSDYCDVFYFHSTARLAPLETRTTSPVSGPRSLEKNWRLEVYTLVN